jgi:hypothetical protein
MNDIQFLFVSCCLEQTRFEILQKVVDNLTGATQDVSDAITVFDNGSTVTGTIDVLRENFKNVFVADHNVGYWTAIDWWLRHIANESPKYTYIIESDMMHYAFHKIQKCAQFLDENSDVGAVRLHEYSVENCALYNKDVPVVGSRKGIWQSHTNRVTGKPVCLHATCDPEIYKATFLTQLPALNRYKAIVRAFTRLQEYSSFSELEFQRLYHEQYSMNAILDGGIFNADDACWGKKVVTGSYTNDEELRKIGYKNTRQSSIIHPTQYTVTKV